MCGINLCLLWQSKQIKQILVHKFLSSVYNILNLNL